MQNEVSISHGSIYVPGPFGLAISAANLVAYTSISSAKCMIVGSNATIYWVEEK